MKARINDWTHGQVERRTKYKHDQEIPIDQVFPIAKEIFDAGLNVMVYQLSVEPKTIYLCADVYKFTQR